MGGGEATATSNRANNVVIYTGRKDITVPEVISGRAVVHPNKPSNSGITAHAAGGIAVADSADVSPHQSASTAICADHTTRGVTVTYRGASLVKPHQPSGVTDTTYTTGRIAIADHAATIDESYQHTPFCTIGPTHTTTY